MSIGENRKNHALRVEKKKSEEMEMKLTRKDLRPRSNISNKEKWDHRMKEQGIRYFVLKCEDFFDVINEEEAKKFNNILIKIERKRLSEGKTPSNKYWVINRNEPYANQVKVIIEQHEEIALKE